MRSCRRLRLWMLGTLGLLMLGAIVFPVAAAELWVAPSGDDSRTGRTRKDAFATIDRARLAIRDMQPLQDDVVVHIAPGIYFLEDTLRLDGDDSAPKGKRITYRADDSNAKPRISGGRLLTGPWQYEGDGVFSTDVGVGDFRQLYVDGRLAVCAREPDAGKWRRLKQWEPMTKTVRLEGSGIMDKWARMEQVEFVAKKHWAISRLHVKWWGTYDGDDVFGPPEPELEFVQAHVPPKANGQRYFFENAVEFLDQPGEWYLDRSSRRLYYRPRAGESLATAEVIAPRLERVIDFDGAAGITLDGLVIEHGNWLRPNTPRGYVGAQANVHWDGWNVNPGAMHLAYTRDVQILNNEIRNCTVGGIVLDKGTRRTRIEGNVLRTIGCTPIAVYTQKNRVPELPDQCCDDVIRNNLIENYGTENFAAAGICVAVATRILVEHNEVRHGGYAGITYGYFSRHESPGEGSRIRCNHIHHVMREMDDGAGIYVFVTKFESSNSALLVERNFIHDVYRLPDSEANPIAGIYLDEGASSVTLRENVIRAVGNTIHLNTGNRGKPNETKRSDQVFDGNTDEQREWEKTAGLQPEFAHLAPDSSKPNAVFKQAELLHHWPLDGDYVDQVTGRTGQAIGDAGFSKTEKARGSAALQLNGKSQWADLGDVEWPDRFTVCLWVKMPMDTTGEKALFSTPGLRVYSGVNIGSFREDLRTTTIEGEHSRDARTEAGVLPCGQWNHVVITIDRWHEAQRVYVNGEDVTNTDHLGHEGFVRRGPLLLGVYNGAGSSDRWRDLNGWVDDVRIYRDHLRAGEVRKLANTPQRMHVNQRSSQ